MTGERYELPDAACIIEFHPIGHQVKVIAVDPATGREVSIIGAASVAKSDLAKLAARKLAYVLGKDDVG